MQELLLLHSVPPPRILSSSFWLSLSRQLSFLGRATTQIATIGCTFVHGDHINQYRLQFHPVPVLSRFLASYFRRSIIIQTFLQSTAPSEVCGSI